MRLHDLFLPDSVRPCSSAIVWVKWSLQLSHSHEGVSGGMLETDDICGKQRKMAAAVKV